MKNTVLFIRTLFIISVLLLASCNEISDTNKILLEDKELVSEKSIKEKIAQWKEVELSLDVSNFKDNEKELLRIFIQISEKIDDLFWIQIYGDKEYFLSNISNEDTLKYAKINYGPWDRIIGRESFMPEYDNRSLGANFYPADIKYLPFIIMPNQSKLSSYTVLKRNDSGELYTVPFHKEYKKQLQEISDLLIQASNHCENKLFEKYLIARANSLLTDNFYESEVAWMKVKDNKIDFLVGPVETNEDKFIHTKAAYESYLLIRDDSLSAKAQRYASLVNNLQNCLPMNKEYKKSPLVVDTDFGVYNVIYYGGRCNAGSKTISVSRPYDTKVIEEFGSRKLQFKNSIDAKFNSILKPIAEIMIADEQLKYVTSESFFEANMLYEISEELGFNTCLNEKPVKEALRDYYQLIEKTRSDIVRVYVINYLVAAKEMNSEDKMKHYVGYLANLFRTIRLGEHVCQAKADMIIFNFFKDGGAILRNNEGKYFIDFAKMDTQIKVLTELIHEIEENGDYVKAKALITDNAVMTKELQEDLKKVLDSKIPIDIVFKQGVDVLGL